MRFAGYAGKDQGSTGWKRILSNGEDPLKKTGQPGKPGRRGYRIIAGHSIVFDDEGFFWRFGDWQEEIAGAMAREGGFELGEDHWKVIRFMREFFSFHGRAPLNRELIKGTGLSLLIIEGLFPEGIKRGARRIAGLPNPRAC